PGLEDGFRREARALVPVAEVEAAVVENPHRLPRAVGAVGVDAARRRRAVLPGRSRRAAQHELVARLALGARVHAEFARGTGRPFDADDEVDPLAVRNGHERWVLEDGPPVEARAALRELARVAEEAVPERAATFHQLKRKRRRRERRVAELVKHPPAGSGEPGVDPEAGCEPVPLAEIVRATA